MRGIGMAVRALIQALGLRVPPLLAPLVAVAVALAALPFIARNLRIKRARTLVVELDHADAARRQEVLVELEALGRRDAAALAAACDEAISRGRRELATRLVRLLKEVGGRPADLRELVERLKGPRPAGTPMGEAIAIERLLAQGADGAARKRLAEARSRWPDDPDLAELAERLEPSEATPEG